MKKLFAWFALACVSSAMAQQEINDGPVKVEQYHYGMHLDVASVISITQLADTCSASPVTMTYRDFEGHIKGIEYIVLSSDCAATNN